MGDKWFKDSVFYHIYPLGYAGAPPVNDRSDGPVYRLRITDEEIASLRNMGINAVYFGPVFESSSHGYDTIDYHQIDRRLGDNDSFRDLVDRLHRNGIKVVLDGVFNHVGREFAAFEALRREGRGSPFTDWFKDVDFDSESPYGDGFSYQGWEGHPELVTLNLANETVKDYLFGAVEWMMDFLNIDGLRLDVAYLLDQQFLRDLSSFCKTKRADFWLMGEIIHGDYRRIAGPELLDSATNYECYKGIYSSHNDRNLFEIAWSLNRLLGSDGLCKDISLYNFVDNHDVDRITSILKQKEHLFTVYALLFTMPGIPSIYYGSEWMVEGVRTPKSDSTLRPQWEDISQTDERMVEQIRILSELRQRCPALRFGDYKQISVQSEQLVFERRLEEQTIIVALNIAGEEADISLPAGEYRNFLDTDQTFSGEKQISIQRYGWMVFEKM